jgi:hypothetical protein
MWSLKKFRNKTGTKIEVLRFPQMVGVSVRVIDFYPFWFLQVYKHYFALFQKLGVETKRGGGLSHVGEYVRKGSRWAREHQIMVGRLAQGKNENGLPGKGLSVSVPVRSIEVSSKWL